MRDNFSRNLNFARRQNFLSILISLHVHQTRLTCGLTGAQSATKRFFVILSQETSLLIRPHILFIQINPFPSIIHFLLLSFLPSFLLVSFSFQRFLPSCLEMLLSIFIQHFARKSLCFGPSVQRPLVYSGKNQRNELTYLADSCHFTFCLPLGFDDVKAT